MASVGGGGASRHTRNSASEVARADGSTVGWVLKVCPAAGEAGGSFRYASRRSTVVHGGPAADPERSAQEGARRARGTLRRYGVANGLNRLGTLTYAGEGCHDPVLVAAHIALFFRKLRALLGGVSFPYAWVPEWHKTDHGLHVHFAVGQYIKRSLIEQAWGRGFVHIKLLSDLPVGSGRFEEARRAAGYLGKYIAKSFEDLRRIAGLHRYDVGQGFQPEFQEVWGRTREDAIEAACVVMGSRDLARVWTSDEVADWRPPPSVWLAWAG